MRKYANNITNLERHKTSVLGCSKLDPTIIKAIEDIGALTKIFKRVKIRAKRLGIYYNLNPNNHTLPEVCPILGIPLRFNSVSHDYDSYSVDRVDNRRGYVDDNICIMSMRANTIKSNARLEELVLLGKWAEKLLAIK